MKKQRFVFIGIFYCLLILILTITGCQKNINKTDLESDIPSLGDIYSEYFAIGAAVNPRLLDSAEELLIKHFTSITTEDALKFSIVHSLEDNYNFAQSDQIVEFAELHNMKVHGHVLIWHKQVPAWLFKDEGKTVSREVLLKRMEDHIKTLVGRYKGRIYCWDVINEAISDEDGEIYLKTPWLEIIGEEYIEKAFEFAHEADPDAILLYNDYSAIDAKKSIKIYNMIKGLKEKGIPVHGVGMQGHWYLNWPDYNDVEKAIDLYASLGLEVQITELDLSVYSWNDKSKQYPEFTWELESNQTDQYRMLFNLFREKKDVISSVTFWGVADDYTWLDNWPVKNRKNWPFLFDEDHKPKQSFWAVVDF
jgi:endo-1,4-beta-xylanase